MSRLIVFGCSLTSYYWPTWADFLGRNFDEYENWAIPGLGNRGIFERFLERSAKQDLCDDDLLIIQWTEFNRFDFHTADQGWMMYGNVYNLSDRNPEMRYIAELWDEASAIMHSCNYIYATSMMLKQLPCRYLMTSMNQMSPFIKQTPGLKIYEKYLETDRWFTPIYQWFNNNRSLYPRRYFDSIFHRTKNQEDPHPSPAAHLDYVRLNFGDKFKIDDDCSKFEIIMDRSRTYEEMIESFKTDLGWNWQDHWKQGY